MQLARFATITTPKLPKNWEKIVLTFETFQVGCFIDKAVKGEHLKVVAATTTLPTEALSIDDAGSIFIADAVRQLGEQAIEHYANLMSVSNYMRRAVSSTWPALALKPQSDNDFRLLASAKGIAAPEGNHGIPGSVYEFDTASQIIHLSDRIDGVAIIAEALGHSQASGRFRDLIRLFERAFGKAGKALVAPLAAFLKPKDGYSLAEVSNWIDVRDGVTHADKKDKILFDGDVAWVVERVTQAAYDVLLNKEQWRSSGTERRKVWSSACGTVNADCGLRVTRSADMVITFRVFDEYRRFPLHLEGAFTGIPAGWWVSPSQNGLPSAEV